MSIEQAPALLIEIAASALGIGLLYGIQRLVEQNETEETMQMEHLRAARRLAARQQVELLKRAGAEGSVLDLSHIEHMYFAEFPAHATANSLPESSARGFPHDSRQPLQLTPMKDAFPESPTRGGVRGERAVDAEVKPNRKDGHYLELISDLRTVGLWLVAAGILLAISACGPRSQDIPTPEAPLPTSEPLGAASFDGIVWHDRCVNLSADQMPPAGCVFDDASGAFIANGVLETGELGMSDVLIKLGKGSCPSVGLAETVTDEAGRYAIEGVWPGEYCLSVYLGGSHQLASLIPGVWTYPEGGMRTVLLEAGEHRSDLNFGWDDFIKPPLSTPEPTPIPRCIDSAEFIKDVTIPDGARIDPGDTFSKIWRLRNNGSCTWTPNYDLVFYAGDRMGGYYELPLRGDVEPREIVDLSVELKAPKSVGTYWGYWMLRNAEGEVFGIGEDASHPFWLKILIDPEISGWRGEYFDNRKLEGEPVLIRNDEGIDFNWKDGAPSSSLPVNNFSARWIRSLHFEAATYRFAIRIDDGVRLWVDDRLVIDEWEEGSVRTVSVSLEMTRGKHDLKLEYFERKGDARAHFDWDKVSISHDEDWIAKYWFNRHLDSDWARVATADEISFDWGSSSPALGIPDDDFSAQWSRAVDFESGTYRLYARADDGIRVAIDEVSVIDEWHLSDAGNTYTAEMALSGTHDVEVAYFERGGQAKAVFWWELIGPVNRPPVGAADEYETSENQVLIVPAPGVMNNDEDPDGDSLSASLVSDVSNGTLTLDPDGSFVYLPEPGYSGRDQFSYQISDGELTSEVVDVTLSVISANTPPVSNDDAFSTNMADPLEVPAPGVLENDLDDDGQTLVAALETEPNQGSVELAGDGSFHYIPIPEFTGEDQFTYRASDGEAASEVATVTITVAPANLPPIALDDYFELAVGEFLSVGPPGILENDHDPDGQSLQLLIQAEPLYGKLILTEDGSFEYMPPAEFSGEDQFTYKVSDGTLLSELAIVQIKVLTATHQPYAIEDSVSGTVDQILEIFVLANDKGLGDGPLTLSIAIPPSEGTVEIAEDRIFYTPNAGFSGEDVFEYVVTDVDGESSQASVLISVIAGLSGIN